VADGAALTAERRLLDGDLLAEVAGLAPAVDGDADADRRPTLARLAGAGALGLGLPGSGSSHVDQVDVLSDLAGVCMSTAFSAWAHRMTVEYLVRHGGPGLGAVAGAVLDGAVPGSTALAATFRAAAGLEDLPVTVDRSTGSARATGFVSWASNLYDDAVVVVGVSDGGVDRLAMFRVADPGVTVGAVTGLLALDASRSGSIVLDGVPLGDTSFLAEPFPTFVASVRPTFLAFQSALCIGLAQASLDAAQSPRGVARSLVPDLDEETATLASLRSQLTDLARWLDHRDGPVPVHPVRLRLEVAHLARRATQLELAVKGGAAFTASSPTARRVREALFLPVQSPTEAQLQWELRRSA